MIFYNAWLLWLLPLAFLPLLLERSHSRHYSWNEMLPKDPLSDLLGLILKILAVLALIFIVLGLSGPHTSEQSVEKVGIGAQIALVLDRSASMDDPFSGNGADGKVGETKSAAASRLMTDFIKQRKNDMMGMITFSNSAMYVLPLTENRDAILAAVQATSGNSLFQTNIGSGLTSGAGLFDNVPDSGSRAIILLSDGAGRVPAETQQKLKEWFERLHVSLYWIVLRQPGGISIFDTNYKPDEDKALPAEIELNNFFKSLNTPFTAYEAEDPKALASAINDINQKEKKPIKYQQRIAGHEFTQLCYFLAALMIGLLIAVKYLEMRTWRQA
ncbi:MAG TPA: vWA domain-containing protein [Methylotenera sp.]|nr:vWA domain-containing protein [Methylotenera sp.]